MGCGGSDLPETLYLILMLSISIYYVVYNPALGKRTQHGFMQRIRTTPSEMHSIVRLLESNIELSLVRVLRDDDPGAAG